MSIDTVSPILQHLTTRMPKLSDEELVSYVAGRKEELAHVLELLKAQIALGESEIERRLIERGARSLPSQTHKIELIEEWSQYSHDLGHLKLAASMLPEEEAAKVIKHIPERVEVVPAHDEAGNPRSIDALRKKYAGTNVEALLNAGMTRSALGLKLVFNPRKVALAEPKNVTPEAAK